MTSANYVLLERTERHILIRDVGPWESFPTVTNDAEQVVLRLKPQKAQRVFYFDSLGELGELVVRDGKFKGFAPCSAIPRSEAV